MGPAGPKFQSRAWWKFKNLNTASQPDRQTEHYPMTLQWYPICLVHLRLGVMDIWQTDRLTDRQTHRKIFWRAICRSGKGNPDRGEYFRSLKQSFCAVLDREMKPKEREVKKYSENHMETSKILQLEMGLHVSCITCWESSEITPPGYSFSVYEKIPSKSASKEFNFDMQKNSFFSFPGNILQNSASS